MGVSIVKNWVERWAWCNVGKMSVYTLLERGGWPRASRCQGVVQQALDQSQVGFIVLACRRCRLAAISCLHYKVTSCHGARHLSTGTVQLLEVIEKEGQGDARETREGGGGNMASTEKVLPSDKHCIARSVGKGTSGRRLTTLSLFHEWHSL